MQLTLYNDMDIQIYATIGCHDTYYTTFYHKCIIGQLILQFMCWLIYYV